jgi:hypothetical protein
LPPDGAGTHRVSGFGNIRQKISLYRYRCLKLKGEQTFLPPGSLISTDQAGRSAQLGGRWCHGPAAIQRHQLNKTPKPVIPLTGVVQRCYRRPRPSMNQELLRQNSHLFRHTPHRRSMHRHRAPPAPG